MRKKDLISEIEVEVIRNYRLREFYDHCFLWGIFFSLFSTGILIMGASFFVFPIAFKIVAFFNFVISMMALILRKKSLEKSELRRLRK